MLLNSVNFADWSHVTLKPYACLSVFWYKIKMVKYFISHMFSLGSLQSLSHNIKFILDKVVPTISSETVWCHSEIWWSRRFLHFYSHLKLCCRQPIVVCVPFILWNSVIHFHCTSYYFTMIALIRTSFQCIFFSFQNYLSTIWNLIVYKHIANCC